MRFECERLIQAGYIEKKSAWCAVQNVLGIFPLCLKRGVDFPAALCLSEYLKTEGL